MASRDAWSRCCSSKACSSLISAMKRCVAAASAASISEVAASVDGKPRCAGQTRDAIVRVTEKPISRLSTRRPGGAVRACNMVANPSRSAFVRPWRIEMRRAGAAARSGSAARRGPRHEGSGWGKEGVARGPCARWAGRHVRWSSRQRLGPAGGQSGPPFSSRARGVRRPRSLPSRHAGGDEGVEARHLRRGECFKRPRDGGHDRAAVALARRGLRGVEGGKVARAQQSLDSGSAAPIRNRSPRAPA